MQRGDFGRVRQDSAWNDVVAATGTAAAGWREEPVSPFPFTDDERDLRGRAWRFLVPAHDGAYLERIVAELVATRVLPADMQPPPVESYHDALAGEWRRSPASGFRRLGEDAAADARLIDPFVRAARRVLAADRIRRQTLAYAGRVTIDDVANAEARVAENRCLVAWVAGAVGQRIEQYRYALEHLVIATPQAQAVPAERSLAMLRANAAELAGVGLGPLASLACLGVRPEEVAVPVPVPAPLPSRPLVVKD